MELTERIPLERLNAIAAMSYTQFKELSSKCKSEGARKERFASLKRYTENLVKAKGEMVRLYKFTDATPLGVGGRLFCGSSIQGISCDIRGYLLAGICTDIDMKNCHQKILEYICNKHHIPCPNLTYYVANRSEILEEMGPEAKTLFLKAVNSDAVNRTVKNKFFKAFDKEMKDLHAQILALPEFDYITATVPPTKTYNWTGSAVNRILCMYENEILQKMVSVINHRGIEICSLMFDGLMVYGNHYDDAGLLAEMEAAIAEYDMKLTYKQHSTVLQLEDIEPTEKEEKHTDLSATQAMYTKYPHWKFCQGTLYVFDHETGMWCQDENVHNRFIIKYGGPYAATASHIKNMRTMLKTMCVDDSWLRTKELSGLGKLLFTNGFYDASTEQLEKFDPEVVFFSRIERPFEPTDDVEDIATRFFYQPLGKRVGRYAIHKLARGIMGDRLKDLYFGLGESNAGKSITSRAVQLAFGDYVGSFNAGNLAFSKSSADEAAKLRWALVNKRKRLLFSNEIKSTEPLDGNMLKKMAAGEDTLVGRNHGGAETEFVPHFVAVIMANDIPKIVPYDAAVSNRVKIMSYNKKFVETPTAADELQMDPNVKTEIETPEFQQKMVSLFIKYYHRDIEEPDAVRAAKAEWIDETPDIMDPFLQHFEITNREVDFTTTTTMQQWLKDTNSGISMVKLGKELKKYCVARGFDKYLNKQKKINGKVVQCYLGIRVRNDDVMPKEMEVDGPDPEERDPEAEYR